MSGVLLTRASSFVYFICCFSLFPSLHILLCFLLFLFLLLLQAWQRAAYIAPAAALAVSLPPCGGSWRRAAAGVGGASHAAAGQDLPLPRAVCCSKRHCNKRRCSAAKQLQQHTLSSNGNRRQQCKNLQSNLHRRAHTLKTKWKYDDEKTKTSAPSPSLPHPPQAYTENERKNDKR